MLVPTKTKRLHKADKVNAIHRHDFPAMLEVDQTFIFDHVWTTKTRNGLIFLVKSISLGWTLKKGVKIKLICENHQFYLKYLSTGMFQSRKSEFSGSGRFSMHIWEKFFIGLSLVNSAYHHMMWCLSDHTKPVVLHVPSMWHTDQRS